MDESVNECTMCGVCEAVCPEVFMVPEKMKIVDSPDYSLVEEILESADSCPVSTIGVEFEGSGKRENLR